MILKTNGQTFFVKKCVVNKRWIHKLKKNESFHLLKGGAAYGTGYCDAQCPHDIKFIDGEANSGDWIPR